MLSNGVKVVFEKCGCSHEVRGIAILFTCTCIYVYMYVYCSMLLLL